MLRGLAYAPLFPVAVAVTAGIVADRYAAVPTPSWFVAAAAGVTAAAFSFRRNPLLSLVGLWVCAGGLAGAYHHRWRNEFRADDIGNVAATEPKLVRVRGSLAEEPFARKRPRADALVSGPRPDVSVAVLDVAELEVEGGWGPASGTARLTVEGPLDGLHVGDEVEVTGWLARPPGPMNPGEWDYASRLQDDRIRAEIRVRHSADGVVRLNTGGWGVQRGLSAVHGWGQRGIAETLPPSEGPVATALLLGDQAAMTADEWDRYLRTGVIHVLAISGQHLVILGAFLWFVLRILGVRRRPAAVIVAATLVAYALMTGGRPSAVRAAVMACALCGSILLRARALPANTFALAWIVVLALNPTDLFTAGFQLSFLCVAVLIWGIPRWFPPRPPDSKQDLIDESRSVPEKLVRGALRLVGQAYLVTLVLGLATAPLVAYWQGLVSPAGVLIGPVAILLTTIALIAGFLLLFVWPLGPLAVPCAWAAGRSLALCDWVVGAADRMPGGCWYVGPPPLWWVVAFYVIGGVWLAAGNPERVRVVPATRPFLFPAALAAWVLVGLVAGSVRPTTDELRVTFLAVDHGACVVIETPDGRTLLYDAGATAGPDVTKRRIAPYLWSRGVRRIDEVFLSHADLDHFNGLPALLDRFAVGQVTITPSFPDKPSPGVRVALEAIDRRGVAVRTARAGDRYTAGELQIDVLHPPPEGPPGVENVRSLVLLLRHRGHTVLLTGDLEGAGVDAVTTGRAPAIDVLMVPHHGAGGPRVEGLAEWARPRLAVSSQGRTDTGKAEIPYQRRRTPYWATWPEGAVTLRSHPSGLTAETFATGQRIVVREGSGAVP